MSFSSSWLLLYNLSTNHIPENSLTPPHEDLVAEPIGKKNYMPFAFSILNFTLLVIVADFFFFFFFFEVRGVLAKN